jgi:hypothetical protein
MAAAYLAAASVPKSADSVESMSLRAVPGPRIGNFVGAVQSCPGASGVILLAHGSDRISRRLVGKASDNRVAPHATSGMPHPGRGAMGHANGADSGHGRRRVCAEPAYHADDCGAGGRWSVACADGPDEPSRALPAR